ncbi:MAG: hypothetical protein CVU48_04070 [Candidatus Cloacimonetes bacterium HGW-Cloacimonetes-1]|nr:MAG: hypothetical protein CVU48_04070 [Candidatus Cloacimonetes bacterium HGW-Cloacimonetes-1]
MRRAIVTPEELRKFALYLNGFNDKLEDSFRSMKNNLDNLGITWQDQEYVRFDDEFKNTLKQITIFLAASRDVVPFLYRKAKAADDYLEQR